MIDVIKFGADENYVILGLKRAFLFEDFNVLFNSVKTLLVCQVEYDYCALTVAEVAPSQREELLLALCVPYLQPHGLILHLQR